MGCLIKYWTSPTDHVCIILFNNCSSEMYTSKVVYYHCNFTPQRTQRVQECCCFLSTQKLVQMPSIDKTIDLTHLLLMDVLTLHFLFYSRSVALGMYQPYNNAKCFIPQPLTRQFSSSLPVFSIILLHNMLHKYSACLHTLHRRSLLLHWFVCWLIL